MFKKKDIIYTEIQEEVLKKLKLFESIDGEWNKNGFNVTYTRIPGGLIRTIYNTEGLDQLFISLPASYFI